MTLHVGRSAGLWSRLRALQAATGCAAGSTSTTYGSLVHALKRLAGPPVPAAAAATPAADTASRALPLSARLPVGQLLRGFATAPAMTAAELEGEKSSSSLPKQHEAQGTGAPGPTADPGALLQQGSQPWPVAGQHGPQRPPWQPFKQDRLVPKMVHAETMDAVQQWLERAAAQGHRLSVREMTAALQALGRLGGGGPMASERARGLLAALFADAAGCFGHFDARGLAIAVQAAAKVGYHLRPEEKAAWSTAVRRQMREFNLVEATNALFCFGKVYWMPGEDVMHGFFNIALRHRQELTGQQAANVLWGLGRTRFNPGPDRVAKLLEGVLPALEAFDTQSIVSILFSLAVLRIELRPEVVSAFLWVLPPRLSSFNARQLSMLIWALGNLNLADHVSDDLWGHLDEALLAKLETSTPLRQLRVPLVLFGAARLRRRPSLPLLAALLQEAEQSVRGMSSRDVGGVLWSLGRVGYKVGDGHVSAHILRVLLERQQELMARGQALSRHVTGALWGLAALELPLDESEVLQFTHFLDAQYTAVGTGVPTAEAAQLLTAFESLGHNPGFQMLRRHISAPGRHSEAHDSEVVDGEELGGGDSASSSDSSASDSAGSGSDSDSDSCSSQSEEEGDRAEEEGDRAEEEGDRAGEEGDRAGEEGDRAGEEGDRAGEEGDRAGEEGDRPSAAVAAAAAARH